ncbi:3-isopropylmalate dehydratase large subunit [Puniceibacterium sp. IMCC21224]|uniref:3-isopropylmalate dehydratase large subunit n=1 Tax=Puniceibacterium sp. IMCC21224 TaxID=1618204 RepID=UPI00064D791A|nr:3-isopropylmalate dehydratase large subunit [Puniceibacterium sp. IMCC21224]KMK69086.1 3-isopropylmalate dehydratase, large subunit [Puniceibacterium sp. IMCC21224]
MTEQKTLYRKLVDTHVVRDLDALGERVLLYIDRTVLNEYTSPQAFSGLRERNRKVWRPEAALGTVDHVNSTFPQRNGEMPDTGAAEQDRYFARNCEDFAIELYDVLHPMQGIEHVVMTESGRILPGMVVAAGDSHTTTYGALGALGFGIGTSDIEHYLATQTLVYKRLKAMRVTVNGKLGVGVRSKDIIIALIRQIGASGAAGYVMELTGDVIRDLSVEARLTVCNMAVEAGARGAIIAPDEKAFDYLKGKTHVPKDEMWDAAFAFWSTLKSDDGAVFDRDVVMDADDIAPMVTWGTSPDQAVQIGELIPDPKTEGDEGRRRDMFRAQSYMGLRAGNPISGTEISHAFIGSCTNARIEDLRDAARILKGRTIAPGVRGIIVPGSTAVRNAASKEGLDRIFLDAGFEWRQSGCSMCLAMNDDILAPYDRCASSTNRNFEGRQGSGSRTHLMSPAMVAAAAVTGHITDSRQFSQEDS